ncbi:alpha/beta fold hydrolase [Aestuariispira ectoiniformans]|uniref:alpha/beta fold hydrolase n=1 Tax=Aestuariispira ectoiniformans TaxID=2775080 RepID=UPI00223C0586|nr:alpha/beta fold hydrolase [Aestuariispira ectoiniformans]
MGGASQAKETSAALDKASASAPSANTNPPTHPAEVNKAADRPVAPPAEPSAPAPSQVKLDVFRKPPERPPEPEVTLRSADSSASGEPSFAYTEPATVATGSFPIVTKLDVTSNSSVSSEGPREVFGKLTPITKSHHAASPPMSPMTRAPITHKEEGTDKSANGILEPAANGSDGFKNQNLKILQVLQNAIENDISFDANTYQSLEAAIQRSNKQQANLKKNLLSILRNSQKLGGRDTAYETLGRVKKRLYRLYKITPPLKGTTFFGGAGMEGDYINDMVQALEEKGISNVRSAAPEKWSTGGMFTDAASVVFDNDRDGAASDFDSFSTEGEQFNLVGYSYGGLQAAQAAADYADDGGIVDNLVLLGTPIEATFLKKLESHPNIKHVEVINLSEEDDPIFAGMSDLDVAMSTPKLASQFFIEPSAGHFYYSDPGEEGNKRRRALASKLFDIGLR